MLVLEGDEDRTTSGRRRPAMSAALHAPSDVRVDLRGLRYGDASLMIDLVILARRLRMQGGVVRLQGPQPQVRAVIELVGLDRQPAVALDASG